MNGLEKRNRIKLRARVTEELWKNDGDWKRGTSGKHVGIDNEISRNDEWTWEWKEQGDRERREEGGDIRMEGLREGEKQIERWKEGAREAHIGCGVCVGMDGLQRLSAIDLSPSSATENGELSSFIPCSCLLSAFFLLWFHHSPLSSIFIPHSHRTTLSSHS